jgi:hypothetical protein
MAIQMEDMLETWTASQIGVKHEVDSPILVFNLRLNERLQSRNSRQMTELPSVPEYS